jgi:ketoreductase RED2
VHAVAPGLIDTPWTQSWDEVRLAVQKTAPLQRSGTPDDVADACVGLISTKYSTGQVLVVDGGMALR